MPHDRDRYLAALSHELRTPLNGVIGMAGLLEGTRLDADQRAYVEAIRECGAHLLGLVNDLLDLAKLDAGKLSLSLGATDPAAILQSVCELMSPRAFAKHLEIAWSAPADLPLVQADEGRLRQVLFNLAGNAVKFTEAGGVVLSIAVVGRTGGQVRLRFAVRDTGPGVPEDQRETIFGEFAQGSRDVARADSAGLGLAIVRRLAEAHGGIAGLDCPPEGGSVFWFEAGFDIAAERPALKPLAGRQVAVVTANPALRAAARAQVEALGGEAIACDTIEAAGALPAGVPALVDHAVRGEKRQVRALAGRPCLILLAPEERARIPRYRSGGYAGYLIKPLRPASVAARLLAEEAGARPAAAVDDERIAAEAAAGARVLLAEDNPVNALLARSLLEREGCVVDHVAAGPDAVEAARVSAYDLILMDLRMPGLDGMGVTRALRERGIATPIVALTADAFEEDRRACLAAGMDDFLTKPLDRAALRAVLSRLAQPRVNVAGFTRADAEGRLTA